MPTVDETVAIDRSPPRCGPTSPEPRTGPRRRADPRRTAHPRPHRPRHPLEGRDQRSWASDERSPRGHRVRGAAGARDDVARERCRSSSPTPSPRRRQPRRQPRHRADLPGRREYGLGGVFGKLADPFVQRAYRPQRPRQHGHAHGTRRARALSPRPSHTRRPRGRSGPPMRPRCTHRELVSFRRVEARDERTRRRSVGEPGHV